MKQPYKETDYFKFKITQSEYFDTFVSNSDKLWFHDWCEREYNVIEEIDYFKIFPGSVYESCNHHPCVCIRVDYDQLPRPKGRSLS